ncbi:exodeoxyribonuclease I [Endozoicomonas numazuensis]|uniref:Exodeoxyribonuclease I n=1 Tax=Endozoicomonas numazuensis TaxID=1137799 RepID=A0A081NMU8_9GAMM|nr:exodeoxyribonuclease I [Endozoicomonas numazuensis]KEQ19771.1 exonuclease I [Endozoicomonas numazuensis]
MLRSFYWHDYETFGTNPATDWPCQFAGIRTDADLNEIGEPLNIFCKLPLDHLAHPMACMVTGLTPQVVNKKGMVEPEFIRQIHGEMMQPGTCAVGYNTLRFDDEVTRNSLYRNFYDPYAREWQNGNSRWDLIDLVRLTGALRPEGIVWPKREDGFNSYKLEELTQANGIDHGDAHDALSDVRATIALARLIRDKQPKVFNFILNLRNKRDVAQQLNLIKKEAVVHISGMFGADKHCLAVVMPLALHPINRNGVVVYDLSVSPEILVDLTVEQIQERLFSSAKEGQERIALKVLHTNKCPVVAPLKVVRPDDQQRLGIDLKACLANRDWLLQHPEVMQKVQQVFASPPENVISDPDQMIYSGGFFSEDDKERMQVIRSSEPSSLMKLGFSFDDARLDEMLLRYRARHYPETLDTEEKGMWESYRKLRLSDDDSRILGFKAFWQAMDEARGTASVAQQSLLDELTDYVRGLESSVD